MKQYPIELTTVVVACLRLDQLHVKAQWWEVSRRRSESLRTHRTASLYRTVYIYLCPHVLPGQLSSPQLLNSPRFLHAMTEPLSGTDPALLTVPEDTRYGRPASLSHSSSISARERSPSPSIISLSSSQHSPSLRARRTASTAAAVSVSGGPYSRPQSAYASIVPTSSLHSLRVNDCNSSRVSIFSTLTRSSAASSYAFRVEGSETATSDHLPSTDLGSDIAEPTHDTAPHENPDEEIILRLKCITPTMIEDEKYTPPRL